MTLYTCDYCGWIGDVDNRSLLGATDPEDRLFECPRCGEPSPIPSDIVDVRKATQEQLKGLHVEFREQDRDPKMINHQERIIEKDEQILTLTDFGHKWEVDLRER